MESLFPVERCFSFSLANPSQYLVAEVRSANCWSGGSYGTRQLLAHANLSNQAGAALEIYWKLGSGFADRHTQLEMWDTPCRG